MTEEQLKRAKQIDEELSIVSDLIGIFSTYSQGQTNYIPRLGRVKRKRNKEGWALYTIRDQHNRPVNEIIIPESVKFIIYSDLKKYAEDLKKELELL